MAELLNMYSKLHIMIWRETLYNRLGFFEIAMHVEIIIVIEKLYGIVWNFALYISVIFELKSIA